MKVKELKELLSTYDEDDHVLIKSNGCLYCMNEPMDYKSLPSFDAVIIEKGTQYGV